jgi:hypothetical protein
LGSISILPKQPIFVLHIEERTFIAFLQNLFSGVSSACGDRTSPTREGIHRRSRYRVHAACTNGHTSGVAGRAMAGQRGRLLVDHMRGICRYPDADWQ